MKNIIKMNFKDLLLFYAIALSVTIFWQLLELLLYKEIKPDHIDSVIAIILSVSIYINIAFYRKMKSKTSIK